MADDGFSVVQGLFRVRGVHSYLLGAAACIYGNEHKKRAIMDIEELKAIVKQVDSMTFKQIDELIAVLRKVRKQRFKPPPTSDFEIDETRHYLGELCKNFHEYSYSQKSLRYISNRGCVACNKERSKKWTEKSVEKAKLEEHSNPLVIKLKKEKELERKSIERDIGKPTIPGGIYEMRRRYKEAKERRKKGILPTHEM